MFARIFITALATLILNAGLSRAVQRPPQQEELRALVRLPQIAPPLTLSLEPRDGYSVFEEIPDFTREIADIRKTLSGGPGDSTKQTQLARLYELQGDMPRMFGALEKARALYQQQLERQQQDALLMSDLGMVLRRIGRNEEAEARLREATLLAPGEWRCWLRLGKFCKAMAFEEMTSLALERPETAFLRTFTRALNRRPASARIDRAQQYLTEAAKAFEKALPVVPEDEEENLARVHFEKALFLAMRGAMEAGFRELRETEIREEKIRVELYRKPVLDEFAKALEETPRDPACLGTLALAETGAGLYHGTEADKDPALEREPWAYLPSSTREKIQEITLKLQHLGELSDPAKSSKALGVLAVLQEKLLKNTDAAQNNLKKALSVRPESERAFVLICPLLAASQNYSDLATICDEHLKLRSSINGRLFAALALENLGQHDESSEQVEAALLSKPTDFQANVAFVKFSLKQDDWNWRTTRIQEALSKAERALSTSSLRSEWIDLALTQGLFLAMQEKADAARLILKSVLAVSRDNSQAREILAILGY